MIAKVFNDLLGGIMEVYVDDLLVKSQEVETHLEYLAQMRNVSKS